MCVCVCEMKLSKILNFEKRRMQQMIIINNYKTEHTENHEYKKHLYNDSYPILSHVNSYECMVLSLFTVAFSFHRFSNHTKFSLQKTLWYNEILQTTITFISQPTTMASFRNNVIYSKFRAVEYQCTNSTVVVIQYSNGCILTLDIL